jgi:hypothetical protein
VEGKARGEKAAEKVGEKGGTAGSWPTLQSDLWRSGGKKPDLRTFKRKMTKSVLGIYYMIQMFPQVKNVPQFNGTIEVFFTGMECTS